MVRVLEFYSGAGLATRGLIKAGAQVVGVDIEPQPRFPGVCLRADVPKLRSDKKFIAYARAAFDFIWASPPCQFGSAMRHAPGAKHHRNLIPATRELIELIGLPYAIENVEGAREHLRDPITLDGGMFGLGVFLTVKATGDAQYFQLDRRRCFETSWKMRQPPSNAWDGPIIGVYGSHARIRAASVPGGRGTSWPCVEPQNYAAAHALGVVGEGLTLAEMSQGIPPAYSRHILKSWKRQAA